MRYLLAGFLALLPIILDAQSSPTAYIDGVNVIDYGATGNGSTDDGQAVINAISESNHSYVVFPRTTNGYLINGDFSTNSDVTLYLNGNIFLGTGIGQPNNGNGTLLSPYTNPWLVATNKKSIYDPAAISQKSNVVNVAESIECLPNHPNSNNSDGNRNWIACVYRGADTGSGGASGTSINTEVDNDVLNINSNSGVGYEIDVNFNGIAQDGNWSRGIFITGGGNARNNNNSIALDIQHSDYGGGWLPWTTGISIREAENQLQMYKNSQNEQGFFIQAFDQNNNSIALLDKNGYATFSGLVLTNGYRPSASNTCQKGSIMSDDDYIYVCSSAGRWKRAALENVK